MKDKKILIIEDDIGIALLVKSVLEKKGYEVFIAENGPDGISRALEIIPDVIILDLMLPKSSGFDVARRLKTDEKTSNTRILALTALSQDHNISLAFQSGVDDYMVKPFSPTLLTLKVESLIKFIKK